MNPSQLDVILKTIKFLIDSGLIEEAFSIVEMFLAPKAAAATKS